VQHYRNKYEQTKGAITFFNGRTECNAVDGSVHNHPDERRFALCAIIAGLRATFSIRWQFDAVAVRMKATRKSIWRSKC
jgi:hypothetical protein